MTSQYTYRTVDLNGTTNPFGLQVHLGLAMSVQFKDIVVKSAYEDAGQLS
jgi:hypothetical protein